MVKVKGEGRGRRVATAHHKVVNQAIVDLETEKAHQVAVVLTIIEMINNKINVTCKSLQHHQAKTVHIKMSTCRTTNMAMTWILILRAGMDLIVPTSQIKTIPLLVLERIHREEVTVAMKDPKKASLIKETNLVWFKKRLVRLRRIQGHAITMTIWCSRVK